MYRQGRAIDSGTKAEVFKRCAPKSGRQVGNLHWTARSDISPLDCDAREHDDAHDHVRAVRYRRGRGRDCGRGRDA